MANSTGSSPAPVPSDEARLRQFTRAVAQLLLDLAGRRLAEGDEARSDDTAAPEPAARD
jgi:hypothetical protein